MTTKTIPSLDELLENSQATDKFKQAVKAFERGTPSDLIVFNRDAPPVKVLRTVMQLLDQEAALAIESVEIKAFSGCSDFVGDIKVAANGDTRVYGFQWDCQWRAEEQGWKDFMGFADQPRAARTYGYQCFKEWALKNNA